MTINLKYHEETIAKARGGNTVLTKTNGTAEAKKANAPTLWTAIATPKFFPVIMVLLIPS